MQMKLFSIAVAATFLLCGTVCGQHLWWNMEGEKHATCLYGEITVLATAPHIYYCGANWHPGEPAGGYCGIQHNSKTERRTIFSIWDTSPQLKPKVTAADPHTLHNRFGGEGTGAHTHMIWDWSLGATFQFFVEKVPGRTPDTTDTRYYIYDRSDKKWRHSATITNPNGGKLSVATIGGGLNSFLENFSGSDRTLPKLALYRLWLGSSLDTMKCLTEARGDGKWGKLHDAYFLAEGSETNLNDLFGKLKGKYGEPVMGVKGKKLEPISDISLDKRLIDALKQLPRAQEVDDK
jgi:Domain of unknown function (DUF3472)